MPFHSTEEEFLNNQKEAQDILIKELNEKLTSIQTWNDILKKKESLLHKALNDLEITENLSPDLTDKIKNFNDQAEKFKKAAEEITKVSLRFCSLLLKLYLLMNDFMFR